jgi:hypothetical protein
LFSFSPLGALGRTANGDGELSLAEFTKAISVIGEDIKQNEVYVNDLYDRRAAPHMAAIKALFDKLDISGTGKLSMDELRDVVAFYEGSEFDEASFLQWYDTNHAIQVERLGAMRLDKMEATDSSDGELDLTEFSWYLVEAANCDAAEMEKTIESFTEAIEYIAAKKATALNVWDHF